MILAAFFLFFQEDIRSVSWWLPHNPVSNELVWVAVLSANLAVLLYILYKLLFRGESWSIPQALRDRGRGIETQLRDAETAHQAAQARLQEIEQRIANLPQELAALQAEAEREAANEFQRISDESRREAERIARIGQQEMAAATKLAQKELKGLAAKLALDLAAQRIRERLTTEMDERVVRDALAGIVPTGGGKVN
ncbi:MAG TPA: ATP synthase F0 subunit B [Terriglobales bacterium]|nr:ATP synthase F0 subunit B [Terriglobales bacterium]